MCLRLIVFCILASIVATLKVKKERCAITKRTNLGQCNFKSARVGAHEKEIMIS